MKKLSVKNPIFLVLNGVFSREKAKSKEFYTSRFSLKFEIYPSLEDCVKRGISPRSTRRFKTLDGRINFSPIDESMSETEANR